jgi:hypothetical protein
MVSEALRRFDPVKHVGGVQMIQVLPFYDDCASPELRGFATEIIGLQTNGQESSSAALWLALVPSYENASETNMTLTHIRTGTVLRSDRLAAERQRHSRS